MNKTHPGYQHSLPTHGPEVAGGGEVQPWSSGVPLPDQGSGRTPEKEPVAVGEMPARHRGQAFPPAQRPRSRARRSAMRVQSGASARGLANSVFLGAIGLPSTLPQKQAKEPKQRAPNPATGRAGAAGLGLVAPSPPDAGGGGSPSADGFLVPFGGTLGSGSPKPAGGSFLSGTT